MSQFMTQPVSNVRHICGTAKPVCGQLEYVMSRDSHVMRQSARIDRILIEMYYRIFHPKERSWLPKPRSSKATHDAERG